jgi:hypothetical protein
VNAAEAGLPEIELHWIMTALSPRGLQGTFDGSINAVPGMHTHTSSYNVIRDIVADKIGSAEFVVLFFSLTPDAIGGAA